MYELANCVDDVKTAIQYTKNLLTAEAVRRALFILPVWLLLFYHE